MRTVIAVALCLVLLAGVAPSRAASPDVDWGEHVTWAGVETTYPVYRQKIRYGAEPFLITDMRSKVVEQNGEEVDLYAAMESYEIRTVTIYRPLDGDALLEDRPVVFFVHGGGWVDGYADWYGFLAQSMTGEMGWVTVVVDYRLTSDEVFLADAYCPDRATCDQQVIERTKAAWYPDNIADVASAFRWTVDHIGEHGGDASRIVIFGQSAGGHLVSLLATHPDYAALRHHIQGVISMSGAYNLPEISMEVFGAALDQTFPGGQDAANAELTAASPTSYTTQAVALPPFYVLWCSSDLPSLPEQGIMFHNRLDTLGFDVEDDFLAGYSHVSEMQVMGEMDELPTQLVVAYMEMLLARETPPPQPFRVALPVLSIE